MAIPLSYNLRSLMVRRVSTLAAALGIGLVVMVFVLVLALAQGFEHAVRTTGSEQNCIVLRKGATSEVTSGILNEEAQSVAVRPQIARDEKGRPLVVPEMIVLVVLPRKDGAPANVVIRGTSDTAFQVRPDVKVREGGRIFQAGLPEIVVGRALSERMKDLALGGTVVFRRQEWKVVGVFDADGTGFESEIWGDADILRSAFRREAGYQSITFRMADQGTLPAKEAVIESVPGKVDRIGVLGKIKADIEGDPRLQLDVKTEAQYYADQSGMMGRMIEILGTLVTLIMSVGAVFGAMNTMYAAVGTRSREVATLRALGFGRGAVLASFLFESLVLAAMGGILGCLFALPIHGLTTGTTNWDTFSELSFAFRLTPRILLSGFLFAILMGALGGLLPAIRAAQLPITVGLRQV